MDTTEEICNDVGRPLDIAPDGEVVLDECAAVRKHFLVASAQHLIGEGFVVALEEERAVLEVMRHFKDCPCGGLELGQPGLVVFLVFFKLAAEVSDGAADASWRVLE